MLQQIVNNILKYTSRNAFFIQDKFYTYHEFASCVSGIRKMLHEKKISEKQKVVGVVSADNIETYAAIIALWLEGMVYLPINPNNPLSRNKSILQQSGCSMLLFSEYDINVKGIISINIQDCKSSEINLDFSMPEEKDLLYIIFTSGSTGIPKGVPITYGNLSGFISDFAQSGYELSEEDRFLQIYDLSFDASVHCYTLPLYIGGCIYTVPQHVVKYMYAYKLLEKRQITFAKMPPSTVSYLKPFFDRIRLPHLKYCLFGGEAFQTLLVDTWRDCVPNAEIHNVYGPTEVTINCTLYNYPKVIDPIDIYQGIATIGKTFGSNHAIIINEKNKIVKDGTKGELCFSGKQVTPGYINNPEKNKEAFINIEINGRKERFYKTGDLAYINEHGNIMFCGRIDNQVQIDGYRVELGEIESKAMEFTHGNVAALPQTKDEQTTIVLFTESFGNSHETLIAFLQENLPKYMVPRKIIDVNVFPKSAGGKINKNALTEYL